MNGTTVHHTDEEISTSEVSDEALEAAGGSMRERAGIFTMAFCSSVNSCPLIASAQYPGSIAQPAGPDLFRSEPPIEGRDDNPRGLEGRQ
jgi:hypothetical protein